MHDLARNMIFDLALEIFCILLHDDIINCNTLLGPINYFGDGTRNDIYDYKQLASLVAWLLII